MKMLCHACNGEAGEVRTLAMTKSDGTVEELEMPLCETCFEAVTAESWIEPAGIAVE
jgi:hypothetical protein